MATRRVTRSLVNPGTSKKSYKIDSDSDSDDDIQVISVQPATKPLPRPGNPPLKMVIRRKVTMGIDLMMECEDEALSPWQQQANQKAEKEYNDAVAQIKAAEASNVLAQQEVAKAKAAVAKAFENGNASDVTVKSAVPAGSTIGQPRLAQLVTQPIQVQPQVLPSSNIHQFAHQGQQFQTQQQPQIIRHLGQTFVLQPTQQGNVLVPQSTARSASVLHNAKQPESKVAAPTVKAATVRIAVTPKNSVNTTVALTVSGTSGIGVKLPVQSRSIEVEKTGWISLDQYYYGVKTGDPNYLDEVGEYRFKCSNCQKMFYNNVELVIHMQSHVETVSLDINDLTTCKYCYLQFPTPHVLQAHVENCQMTTSKSQLMCRICEREHSSGSALIQHMRQFHNQYEMPYACSLCGFRSSYYADVLDHFKKKHDCTDNVICMYCLRIFNLRTSKAGYCVTKVYMDHLSRHMIKNSIKKCSICRLSFCNKHEMKTHKAKDHQPNPVSQVIRLNKYDDKLMLRLNDQGKPVRSRDNTSNSKLENSVKSLNAPSSGKQADFKGLQFPGMSGIMKCFECRKHMGLIDHYRKYVECSRCRYATACSSAYANHMTKFHSEPQKCGPKPCKGQRIFCQCGYSTTYGNKMGTHLVKCGYQTCYPTKPDPSKMRCKREPATLFDVLGLVKKPETIKVEICEMAETEDLVEDDIMSDGQQTAKTIMENVLDSVNNQTFLKELNKDVQASSNVKQSNNEEIPTELTGTQKWKTVQIQERRKPSLDEIFGTKAQMMVESDDSDSENIDTSKIENILGRLEKDMDIQDSVNSHDNKTATMPSGRKDLTAESTTKTTMNNDLSIAEQPVVSEIDNTKITIISSANQHLLVKDNDIDNEKMQVESKEDDFDDSVLDSPSKDEVSDELLDGAGTDNMKSECTGTDANEKVVMDLDDSSKGDGAKPQDNTTQKMDAEAEEHDGADHTENEANNDELLDDAGTDDMKSECTGTDATNIKADNYSFDDSNNKSENTDTDFKNDNVIKNYEKNVKSHTENENKECAGYVDTDKNKVNISDNIPDKEIQKKDECEEKDATFQDNQNAGEENKRSRVNDSTDSDNRELIADANTHTVDRLTESIKEKEEHQSDLSKISSGGHGDGPGLEAKEIVTKSSSSSNRQLHSPTSDRSKISSSQHHSSHSPYKDSNRSPGYSRGRSYDTCDRGYGSRDNYHHKQDYRDRSRDCDYHYPVRDHYRERNYQQGSSSGTRDRYNDGRQQQRGRGYYHNRGEGRRDQNRQGDRRDRHGGGNYYRNYNDY